jgi:hypothetical protein
MSEQTILVVVVLWENTPPKHDTRKGTMLIIIIKDV